LNEKVTDLYNETKSYFDMEDYAAAVSKLNELLGRLRDLNIAELFRLTQANDEGIHLIKGRNIHLLIGPTGSGKSTTLQFLGGSRMANVTLKGQPHIEATEVTNPYLKRVKSNPTIESETRHIIPVVIELDRSQGFMEPTAIFCDSPGFEGTNGAEIDIANSLAIQKAAEVCQGIKPIVVTSKLVGDKFQGLSDVAHILSGMFNNFQQDLKHFSYIYTKYASSERESLRQTLCNIMDTLLAKEKKGEGIDKSFLLVIQDMVKKSRKKG
jgi:energy-coupling factor transporter ATP-binding protein EcfA2